MLNAFFKIEAFSSCVKVFFWLSARTSRSVFATAPFRCYVEKPANADEVPQIELSVHTGGGFYIDLLAVPFEYPFPGKQGQSPSLIFEKLHTGKSDVTEWTKNVAVVCSSVSERSFDRQAVFNKDQQLFSHALEKTEKNKLFSHARVCFLFFQYRHMHAQCF